MGSLAFRNVHIISDGTPGSTKVVGPDGKEIEGVTEISISTQVRDDFVEVSLTIVGVALDMGALVREITWICPLCEGTASHECR